MNNLKTFPKFLLFIVVLSGSLWLGSYLARLVISYQIFEGTDFTLRNYVNDQNLGGILKSFEPAVIATLILYIIFIISFILFILTSKISLKENGWLFVITVIIFLTMPFEIYLSTIDYKMIGLLNTINFNSKEVLDLVMERFKIFSSFPVIEIFCYAAIVFLILFQPLKMNKKVN